MDASPGMAAPNCRYRPLPTAEGQGDAALDSGKTILGTELSGISLESLSPADHEQQGMLREPVPHVHEVPIKIPANKLTHKVSTMDQVTEDGRCRNCCIAMSILLFFLLAASFVIDFWTQLLFPGVGFPVNPDGSARGHCGHVPLPPGHSLIRFGVNFSSIPGSGQNEIFVFENLTWDATNASFFFFNGTIVQYAEELPLACQPFVERGFAMVNFSSGSECVAWCDKAVGRTPHPFCYSTSSGYAAMLPCIKAYMWEWLPWVHSSV